MIENSYVRFRYIDKSSDWEGMVVVVVEEDDVSGRKMSVVYRVTVKGDYVIDRCASPYGTYEEANEKANDCIKMYKEIYNKNVHKKLLERMVGVMDQMNETVADALRGAYFLDKPIKEIMTYDVGKARALDAEKYYDDATPKFMQDFSVFDEQLGGGKPSDYTGVNTMVSNSMYVSPTMDGSYSKPEAVVKTVNVMDAEEFDKHIDSILKYNGLIYELRNEFDKLKDTKDLTDDQVRVLMLNKMLQKLLDAGMSPEDLAVMKRENEYYKKSCEDLLNTIEKDSDEADRLRLKLKMQ